ncbi:MAG: class II fructose-bisphosphatase [Candidatus Aenigmarchaeota archaeon]|nr:class II fructose-bisphosphatase [Candidatus Aenigmarchaeota archaeon]
MDDRVISGLLRATENAAIAASEWVGRGDKKAADAAAVVAMREAMNDIAFEGTVVIGEGERDEAPMLFIGERLGKGGPAVDIAVDPLEGTNLTARGDYNSITVLAVSPHGTLLHAPDTYMEKIAVGPKVGRSVSLSKSVAENINAAAKALGKPVDDIVVTVLDRERHAQLIDEIRKAGARVKLITDGDIYGAISACTGGCDILMGTGAAPEGVIAASAVKSMGGYMEGMLKFRNEEERERAAKYGLKDAGKKMTMDDMVKSDESAFIATGVTQGVMLDGVKGKETHSVIIDKSGTRFIRNARH